MCQNNEGSTPSASLAEYKETQDQNRTEQFQLTPTSPNAPAKLQRQIAVLLQQLRAHLVQRYALDHNVLGNRVLVYVVAIIRLAGEDGVVAREGRDDRRRAGHVPDQGCARQCGGIDGFLDYAHLVARVGGATWGACLCGSKNRAKEETSPVEAVIPGAGKVGALSCRNATVA